jgi:hypothetical protein
MRAKNDLLRNNDANWFTVFMKAFVEKFEGEPPTKEQWCLIIQVLEKIPTHKLSFVKQSETI